MFPNPNDGQWANEPRDEIGRWTAGGDSDDGADHRYTPIRQRVALMLQTLPPAQQNASALTATWANIERLNGLICDWGGADGLSDPAFCQHYFGPVADSETARLLRQGANQLLDAKTDTDLWQAANTLAKAFDRIPASQRDSFLADAAGRAQQPRPMSDRWPRLNAVPPQTVRQILAAQHAPPQTTKGDRGAPVLPARWFGPTPRSAGDAPVWNHGTPEQVRQTVADIAGKYKDSTNWLKADPHGDVPAGSYKCNAFVADVLEEAGIPAPRVHDTYLHEASPTAGDWGDPAVDIPGWVVVTLAPGEQPQPGDVIAERNHVPMIIGELGALASRAGIPGVAPATGHVGIIVQNENRTILTASSSSIAEPKGIITLSKWGLTGNENVVIRRYVGKGRPA